jgi:Zn-dependent peptidase ImmA (M78 family)
MLVPLEAIERDYRRTQNLTAELERLAKSYKVSTLVILRRLRDAGGVDRDAFWSLYEAEAARVRVLAANAPGGSGGNFYNTQPVRTSKRFARAVIASTLEGKTLYTEAFRLLGFKKVSTLNELADRLGVA